MTRRDRTTGLPRQRGKQHTESKRPRWTEGHTRWVILGGAALLLIVVIGLAGFRWYEDNFIKPSSTVLTVYDETYSLEYFTDRLPEFAQNNPNLLQGMREPELLTKLAEEAITIRIAEDRDYDLSEEAVTQYIAEDLGTEPGGSGSTFDTLYRQRLRETGMSSDDYRRLSRAALAESLILEDIQGEIPETMETVRPRVIVVQSEDDAQSIMEQLDEGENFGTLAQTESLEPTSRQEDGYMEAQPRELLPEELRTALADLDEGETLDEPVEINGNWWIVQLGEIMPDGTLTDSQREQLADQQLTELLEERRQEAQEAGEIDRSLGDDDIQWAYDNLEVPAGLTSGQN